MPDAGVFEGGGVRAEQLDGRPHARDAQPGQIGHDDELRSVICLDQRSGPESELNALAATAHSGTYPQLLVDRCRVEHRLWHGELLIVPGGSTQHLGEHPGDGGEMLGREVEEQNAREGRFEGGADECGQQPSGDVVRLTRVSRFLGRLRPGEHPA